MQRIGILILVTCVIVVLFGLSWTRRGKKLSPQVQEVREFDPKSILFSLPTICDEAPETVPTAGHDSPDALHIHEDDLRQIEFIAGADRSQIDREMSGIESFKNANRAAAGWKSVYIRKERPDGPFPIRLPYSLIDSIPHGPIQGLVIGAPGREATVKGGFAVRLGPSLFMYGRQFQGIIVNLALSRLPDESESVENQSLLALCKKFNLVIADWCAGRVVAQP